MRSSFLSLTFLFLLPTIRVEQLQITLPLDLSSIYTQYLLLQGFFSDFCLPFLPLPISDRYAITNWVMRHYRNSQKSISNRSKYGFILFHPGKCYLSCLSGQGFSAHIFSSRILTSLICGHNTISILYFAQKDDSKCLKTNQICFYFYDHASIVKYNLQHTCILFLSG